MKRFFTLLIPLFIVLITSGFRDKEEKPEEEFTQRVRKYLLRQVPSSNLDILFLTDNDLEEMIAMYRSVYPKKQEPDLRKGVFTLKDQTLIPRKIFSKLYHAVEEMTLTETNIDNAHGYKWYRLVYDTKLANGLTVKLAFVSVNLAKGLKIVGMSQNDIDTYDKLMRTNEKMCPTCPSKN